MSEQIKYEAVFGDQALFDEAGNKFDEMHKFIGVMKCEHGSITVYSSYTNLLASYAEMFAKCDHRAPKIAMRRIIKAPVWTKEDQKAGKSPEAGAEVMCMDDSRHNFVGESIHAGHWALCHGKTKKVFHIPDTAVMPVETDAERQQREREEWCSKALDSAGILSEMKHYELKRLGEYIGSIHDALLSGELKAPKGGE